MVDRLSKRPNNQNPGRQQPSHKNTAGNAPNRLSSSKSSWKTINKRRKSSIPSNKGRNKPRSLQPHIKASPKKHHSIHLHHSPSRISRTLRGYAPGPIHRGSQQAQRIHQCLQRRTDRQWSCNWAPSNCNNASRRTREHAGEIVKFEGAIKNVISQITERLTCEEDRRSPTFPECWFSASFNLRCDVI